MNRKEKNKLTAQTGQKNFHSASTVAPASLPLEEEHQIQLHWERLV